MTEARRHRSMTAVQAYTTGCRNSPGYWGKERTVFKSWKGSQDSSDRYGRDSLRDFSGVSGGVRLRGTLLNGNSCMA